VAKLNTKLTLEAALNKGYVPAECVMQSLKDLTAEALRDDVGDSRTTAHEEVASVTGVDSSAIRRVLNGQKDWITFAHADKILCKANRVDDWHSRYNDIYMKVRLT